MARRDQRLATLRLVGATPGQVVGMTVAEAVIVAFAGALAGTAAYALAVPLLTRIEISGGPWFAADLLPHPLVLGRLPGRGAAAGGPVGGGRAAAGGGQPARRGQAGDPARHALRPGSLALLAVLAVVPMLGQATSVTVVAVVIGLAFLCVNLVGPWVVGIIGRVTAATARGPARLLAGRSLVDDPRSAWRTVSGVAMTGFVAGSSPCSARARSPPARPRASCASSSPRGRRRRSPSRPASGSGRRGSPPPCGARTSSSA